MAEQVPSREEMTDLGRRFREAINAHDLSNYDELVSADFIEHEELPGVPAGPGAPRQFFETIFAAFPDFRYVVEDELVDGDKLVWRVRFTGTHQGEFLGIPGTGKRVDVKGIDIVRYVDGRAAEHWGVTDTLGMLQQLGVAPPAPGQGGGPA